MYRRFLSVRYFRTRLVNWLSVVGVMVGVAVMIVVWSVFTGFATETKRVIRGTLADVELSPTGPTDPPDYPDLERLLRRSPDVVACRPMMLLSSVDLPMPLRPISTVQEPCGTVMSTSHNVWLPP